MLESKAIWKWNDFRQEFLCRIYCDMRYNPYVDSDGSSRGEPSRWVF